MSKTVYVITNTELGWDCVKGVYKTKNSALDSLRDEIENSENMSYKELESEIDDTCNIIHQTELE